MVRFFVGLLLGILLTVFSFGFIGVGHGTYTPMVFSGSLVALIVLLDTVIPIFCIPFLWGFYFLLVPRIRKRSARIISVAIIISLHLIVGIWVALKDEAFAVSLKSEPSKLGLFGLVLASAFMILAFLAVRGTRGAELIPPAIEP
jgi:hypothetical protein